MAFTSAQLQTLDDAIAAGVKEVRFQDRTIVYADIKAMKEARALLYSQLHGSGMVRQVRLYGDSGL